MVSNSQGMLLAVAGEFPVDPVIRLQPTVQRAAPIANVGWKYRRRCTITNTGGEPIANYPYAIDLGLTNGLVSGGKAQADADDLRVWRNGQEVARTLVDWNSGTTATLVWIVIPYLGAGESQVWDVVYGNSAAVAAGVPALTLLDDLPAFDVQTAGANRSTNAKWVYAVNRVAANAGKGGWGLSTGGSQPDVAFGVPGGWQLTNTLQSDDDRTQEAYSTFVDTNTYYQGRFQARRARPGSLVVGRNSGADGVALRNPVGISSVRCDLKWTNLSIGDADDTPIGRVVILTRNNPNEEWKPLYSNTALQTTEATIATATYTPAAAVKEVAFAVWPYSGSNVDATARPDKSVEAAWNTTLELNLVNTVVTQSLAAEEEIYELATELRSGGGGEAIGVPPYKSIFLGNAKATAGQGTPRLACKLNEQVVVDTDARTVEIWNSALTAKVETAPIAAVRAVDGIRAADGSTVEQVSAEWMPLLPVVNPLTNPSADANAANWSNAFVSPGITVGAISRDTGTVDTPPASFSQNISASTGAVDSFVEVIEATYLPVGNRESVWVGVNLRVESVNRYMIPKISFYDANQAFLTAAIPAAFATMPAGSWVRRIFAAAVPSGAVFYRVGAAMVNEAANLTGTFRWDTVEVNDTELVLIDVATGTIALTVSWNPRYAIA